MKNRKCVLAGLALSLMLAVTGCGTASEAGSAMKFSMTNEVAIVSSDNLYSGAKIIDLSEDQATLDGEKITEYDYTWNCDPTVAHDEVEDAPAEYYTGTKPASDQAAYVDHELYYYPLLEESAFQKVNYDGEQEWVCYYKDGENEDYIFSTLPVLGASLPTQMMHSKEEAADNKVLHIVEPGTYVLRGAWKGQIKIDLGEDAYSDENSKVKLILDGADIECSVAPAILFENVYECDQTWEEVERTDASVDTSEAGATIVVADGSENYLSGQNVYRMLKTKYKDEESADPVKTQKKMRKTDGALYSYMTMNIDGEEKQNGKLTVDSGYEGIDSELHLTVNGGTIIVNSQDDGMNVNEDHISVISFLGGDVSLNAALGAEGDGVDSNGYIMVDGGTIRVNGIRVPDSALDSEDGIYYQSGTIVIDGQEQEYTAGSVFRETRNEGMGFGREKDFDGEKGFPGGGFGRFEEPEDFDIKEFKEKVSELDDDASFEDVLSLLGISMPNTPPDVQAPDGQTPNGSVPNGPAPESQAPESQAPNGQTPNGLAPNEPAPDTSSGI